MVFKSCPEGETDPQYIFGKGANAKSNKFNYAKYALYNFATTLDGTKMQFLSPLSGSRQSKEACFFIEQLSQDVNSYSLVRQCANTLPTDLSSSIASHVPKRGCLLCIPCLAAEWGCLFWCRRACINYRGHIWRDRGAGLQQGSDSLLSYMYQRDCCKQKWRIQQEGT